MSPLLAFAILAPHPSPLKPFAGTYEVISIVDGKHVDNRKILPGLVKVLELHIEGNWVMRDASAGFDGAWHVSGGKLVLITANGPGGRIPTPEKWILVPKPDRRLLVPRSPKMLVGQIVFRYAPHIRGELAKRTEAAKT